MKRPDNRWKKEESGQHVLDLRPLVLSERWDPAVALILASCALTFKGWRDQVASSCEPYSRRPSIIKRLPIIDMASAETDFKCRAEDINPRSSIAPRFEVAAAMHRCRLPENLPDSGWGRANKTLGVSLLIHRRKQTLVDRLQ